MSTVGAALTTWEEFLRLPDEPPEVRRYELHDGEVVTVPPPRLSHVYVQKFLSHWLTLAAQGLGSATTEFPYRPAMNLQFWYADVAYLPEADWQSMKNQDYPVYAPPLIIEVLSPSNRPGKLRRQRLAAFAGGTVEFWVIDPDRQTVEVSLPGASSRIYTASESVPVLVLAGTRLAVAAKR